MNIGRHIVAEVLDSGSLKPYLDAGMTKSWLRDGHSGSFVLFNGVDKAAYLYLLDHYQKHGTVASLELFEGNFPPVSYRLPKTSYKPGELIEVAKDEVARYHATALFNDLVELDSQDRHAEVPTRIREALQRIDRGIKDTSGRPEDFSDVDIDEFLSRELEMGVPFGIDLIDNEFYGFQPGQLVTLLGRQKSSKSWLMLHSALQAWEQGWDVLFYSVELERDLLRQRLYSMGARVSPDRMRRGKLREQEKARVRDFHKRISGDSVKFKVSQKSSLITMDDIAAEVEALRPHAVYIDGFYFMQDRQTHKSAGSDWQANENVAAELKALAMDKRVVVITSTQAQEKQQGKRRLPGIEARTIMGGTGLLKASDLVLGLDRDDAGSIVVNEVLNRFARVPDVRVQWDWDNMTMQVEEHIDLDAEMARQRDEFVATMEDARA